MKKLLLLTMALVMTLTFAACGGSKADPDTPASNPEQDKKVEFTEEQQAFAQEFTDMVDDFNNVVDRVNANQDLLGEEEFIATMNELAAEITAADEYFTKPESLTPEIMSGLKVAVEATRTFITEAEAVLDEIDSSKDAVETYYVTVPVEIINYTGVDIHGLSLSPANNDQWGDNLITEVIKEGETAQGELAFTEDTLVWDILVQDSSDNQLIFMGVDFSDASTDGAKLYLEATEGGDYYATVN